MITRELILSRESECSVFYINNMSKVICDSLHLLFKQFYHVDIQNNILSEKIALKFSPTKGLDY